MEGRYVNIVIPGRKEYLTLCEVEVSGEPSANTGELYHIKCSVNDFEQITSQKVKSNMLTACSLLSPVKSTHVMILRLPQTTFNVKLLNFVQIGILPELDK